MKAVNACRTQECKVPELHNWEGMVRVYTTMQEQMYTRSCVKRTLITTVRAQSLRASVCGSSGMSLSTCSSQWSSYFFSSPHYISNPHSLRTLGPMVSGLTFGWPSVSVFLNQDHNKQQRPQQPIPKSKTLIAMQRRTLTAIATR